MKARTILPITVVAMMLILFAGSVLSGELKGTARAGFVFVDDEGNRGVYQPTYNLYQGPVLSFEKFSYRFDDGTRILGNFKNVTLNNRNLLLGVSRGGLFGLTVKNNQYRRTYSFEGESFTRRRQSDARVWFQPHEYVRLYGGFGQTDKHGQMVASFEQFGSDAIGSVDYTQNYFNTGLRLGHNRSFVQVDYRASDFSDDLNTLNDRKSNRFRATMTSPVPTYDNLIVNGGFQHYANKLENRPDTLTVNTGWAGLRFFYGDGYHARYSFIFDRARRTGDLTATDNITHSLYAGKTWRNRGGVTAGYRYMINDDVRDELSTNGYYVSGWFKPVPRLTVRAGYGSEITEVQSGRTLTGDEDYSRQWASARYGFGQGYVRVKLENKKRDNDDIGSTAEFMRLSTDLTFSSDKYGRAYASYAFHDGDYHSGGGCFEFQEHVISGDLLSAEYRGLQLGFGGTYMRSKRDLDVESFGLRFSGLYSLMKSYKLELAYGAYNFDDFDDPSPTYRRYYTANVIEVNLIKEF